VAHRDFAGATVAITGGAGGIGLAIASRFAALGATPWLIDVDATRLSEAARAISGARALVVDLTDLDACRSAIKEIRTESGALDALVNNAGITHRSPFIETDPAVITRVMEVNYLGSVNVTSAALPSLIESGGAIGVVTSIAGFAPVLGRTGYVGSKHALTGLFSTLRAEVRPYGVDVTIIAPTFVATDMQTRALDGGGSITTRPQSRVGKQVDAPTVAERAIRAMERRKRTVVIGRVGHVTRAMTAVAPGIYERMMARSLRSELDRRS
jgi:NAD(P)-dependent dehydrogenase (short-subunit alcohol dehydrogenase family)